MTRTLPRLGVWFRNAFSLREALDEAAMIEEINAGVEFRGTTLWALVLAIVVASVGLNVNSTAVIIGAMLISPLMGPIIGAGLALGINDTGLLRRAVRNLAIAAAVSVVTSAIYFSLSPLADAQSELLARTRPTIYDVLIALAGGSAGVIAATRRSDRGNVLPGVAIATALMPPLCTAGYGIANGDPAFVLGALYLFVINSVFICLSTLGVIRLLGFQQREQLEPDEARRRRVIITAAIVITIVPSIYVAWQVVRETRFDGAARRFAAENLVFTDRSAVQTAFRYGRDSSTIETTLIGQPLGAEAEGALVRRLESYGLGRTRLVLHQSGSGTIQPEQLGQVVRAGILEDLYKRNESALASRDDRIRVLESEIVRLRSQEGPMSDATSELGALYPELRSLLLGRVRTVPGTAGAADSTLTVVATWRRVPPQADQQRIGAFLRQRLHADSLRLRHVTDR